MNSFGSRLNVLFFFFLSVMIGLACLTNVTTMFRSPSPPVRVTISNPAIVKYRPAPRYPSFEPGGKARIKFDLDADLRGIFDWSVRQAFIWITAEYPGTGKSVKNEVVIWDAIVEAEDKQDALFQVKDLYSKYKLSDYASSIKNVPITLTLHWETSPWTGFFNVFHASKYSQRSESFTFNLR